MDALSALNVVAPQLGTQLTNPVEEAGAAKFLSPGISAQPLNGGESGASFENLLGNFVNEVSAQQNAGADTVNGLLSGKNVSLHQAMISMEEANVSFQMMVEVRNKLLDSYQELMRMSV